MQKIKLRTEESGKKLSAAYAPPKWSETAEEEYEQPPNNILAGYYKWMNVYPYDLSMQTFSISEILSYYTKS